MRKSLALFALAAAVAAFVIAGFTGCASEATPAETLEFRSNNVNTNGLAVPKDKSVIIGIVARDKDGKEIEIDVGALEWESSDPSVVEVKGLGDACLVTGLHDWFDSPAGDGGMAGGAPGNAESDAGTGGADAGTEPPVDGGGGGDAGPPPEPIYGKEPEATLTAHYGGATASIPVRVVLNAEGKWRVVIDKSVSQDLSLTQNGRNVAYTGTADNASGTIDGTSFSLTQPSLQVTLTGTFTTKVDVSGTYVGPGGVTGEWVAQKQP
jgi:hypothetical protein